MRVTEGDRRALRAWLAPLLEEVRALHPVPGGVLSVADETGTLFVEPFGLDDLARSSEMEPDRAFQVGSISKFFTALAVDDAVQRGALAWEDPVGRWLGWADLDERVAEVTLAQLANHTSGLPAGGDALPDDAAEILSAAHLARTGGPAVFRYSNLGYLMLGEAVRAATGRALGDLVEERVLGPAGMTGAAARVSHEMRARLAVGHWSTRPDRPWAPGDGLEAAPFVELDAASGNVIATSADMDALSAAVLRAARGEGAGALGGSALGRALADLAPGGEPVYCPPGVAPATSSLYGRGINLERVAGRRVVSHGGGMVGHSTFWLVDLDLGGGVSVLSNANGNSTAAHSLCRALHQAVADLAEGHPPTPTTLDTRLRAALGLGRYVGPRGELEVLEREGALRVRFEGREGGLFRRAGHPIVSDHPALRRFALGHEAGRWTWGPESYLALGESAPAPTEPHPLEGHYRSWSPWYRELRIYQRDGRLYLAAGDDVEAPTEEQPLSALREGTWRVGAPDAPERLHAGPARGGEVVLVERDNCPYSRVFTP